MRRAQVMVNVLVPDDDDHMAVEDTIREILDHSAVRRFCPDYEVLEVKEVLR